MEPIKPLSVKFEPPVRERIKRIAYLLDWSEGQFVNSCAAIVLELIDDPAMAQLHKTIFLAQQAQTLDQTKFKLSSTLHPESKN